MSHHHHHHRHHVHMHQQEQEQHRSSIVVGNTTVVRGESVAYTISSPSKQMIDSMYYLFSEYGHHDASPAPGKDRDAGDALHHLHQYNNIATSQLKLNFTMTKPVAAAAKRGGGGSAYEISISGSTSENKQQYSVNCTTLREYMQDRTRAMSYERALRMLELLRKQMTDLEVLNLSTPYYGLDDILVINDVFFCFANDDKLFAYDAGTKQMDVTRAISRERAFYAPELLHPSNKINALPYSVDYRASYYSLGMLAAYCVLLKPELMASGPSPTIAITIADGGRKKKAADDNNDNSDNSDNSDKKDAAAAANRGTSRVISSADIAAMLHPIQYTKLYWFIVRCCNDDVARINSRMLIFV